MKRTTVYLEEELDLAFSRLARQRRQPKAALLREALSSFLAAQEDRGGVPSWLGAGDSSRNETVREGLVGDETDYGEHLEREYEEILESYKRSKART